MDRTRQGPRRWGRDTGKELEGPRASRTRSRWGCGPYRECGQRPGNRRERREGAAPAPARRTRYQGTRDWLSAQDMLERLLVPALGSRAMADSWIFSHPTPHTCMHFALHTCTRACVTESADR